eukprot:g51167.t1
MTSSLATLRSKFPIPIKSKSARYIQWHPQYVSSDDIITSVVLFPFPYSPPLGTVFPATCLLPRPRPLFIPISPPFLLPRHNPTPYTCTFIPCRPCSVAMCPCSRQWFLLRLVLCLSFVRYSLPSHLIAMPQFDLCLDNGIHCDLVPVPTGHISPSIFVSIPVAPWPVRVPILLS